MENGLPKEGELYKIQKHIYINRYIYKCVYKCI